MKMASAQSAAAKNDVIAHMNKDHSDSLSRYLQHYHKLSAWRAYDAQMIDIDVDGLNVTASGKIYRIPFHPPMKSLSDSRVRLVEMDKYVTAILHRSDVTIKRYVPPYGKWLVADIVILGLLYTTHDPSLWAPTGPFGKHLGQLQPMAQTIVAYIAPRQLKYVAVAHAFEVLYFTYCVLPHHSVSTRAPQFWLWAISVFLEGVGAQGRFKEVVANSRREKAEQQKH